MYGVRPSVLSGGRHQACFCRGCRLAAPGRTGLPMTLICWLWRLYRLILLGGSRRHCGVPVNSHHQSPCTWLAMCDVAVRSVEQFMWRFGWGYRRNLDEVTWHGLFRAVFAGYLAREAILWTVNGLWHVLVVCFGIGTLELVWSAVWYTKLLRFAVIRYVGIYSVIIFPFHWKDIQLIALCIANTRQVRWIHFMLGSRSNFTDRWSPFICFITNQNIRHHGKIWINFNVTTGYL